MRKIEDHRVEGAGLDLEVWCVDEPGHGGACHEYRIQRPDGIVLATINFQNGPIKEHGVNGIGHEQLLAILIDRLKWFQSGPYACEANAIALGAVRTALGVLKDRTRERLARNVEGTSAK